MAPASAAFMAEVCQASAVYTTKASDNGRALARRFFPHGNTMEMWASIIACNPNLQHLYASSTTVQWVVPAGLDIIIPDLLKAAQTQAQRHIFTAPITAAAAAASSGPANCGCSSPVTVTTTMPLLKAVTLWFKKSTLLAAAELLRCNPDMQMESGNILAGQVINGICLPQTNITIATMAPSARAATEAINVEMSGNVSTADALELQPQAEGERVVS